MLLKPLDSNENNSLLASDNFWCPALTVSQLNNYGAACLNEYTLHIFHETTTNQFKLRERERER